MYTRVRGRLITDFGCEVAREEEEEEEEGEGEGFRKQRSRCTLITFSNTSRPHTGHATAGREGISVNFGAIHTFDKTYLLC